MFNFKNCKYSRNKCVKFDILLKKKDIKGGVRGDKIMYYVCFIFFFKKQKIIFMRMGEDIKRYEFIDIAII